MRRPLKTEVLLAQNIRALLTARRIDATALAAWCGHKGPWISKILSESRGVQIKDLAKIADFFGLTVAELFQYGIAPLTERRKSERRTTKDRRSGTDRRQGIGGRLHPDVQPRFPERRSEPPAASPLARRPSASVSESPTSLSIE